MQSAMLPSVFATEDELSAIINRYVARGDEVLLDIETTGLNPRSGKLVMLQVQQIGKKAAVFDLRRGLSLKPLEALFDSNVRVVGHNISFDLQWIKYHFGLYPKNPYCTMLAEQILDAGLSENKAFNLKVVAENYGIKLSKEQREWFFNLDEREDWNLPFPDEELEYGAKDVEVLETIYLNQIEKLKQRKLWSVANLEFKTMAPIVEIESNGLLVDEERWRDFIARKQAEAEALEDECKNVFGPAILARRIERFDQEREEYDAWNAAKNAYEEDARKKFALVYDGAEMKWGDYKREKMRLWRQDNPNPGRPHYDEVVNVGSQQQMMEAFEAMKIPAKSFKAEDIKMLADDYPVLNVLLEYKHKAKLVDAFGEKLLAHIDTVDGRIHTHVRQIIDTGRIACSSPNLQQMPSKGLDGKELRSLFIARPGHKLIVSDFAGIEDRILCYLSNDVQKRRIFDTGLDSHTETARLLFHLQDGDDVRTPQTALGGKSYRDVAKTLNYGLVYGLSAFRLAKALGITTQKAEELHGRYFEIYSGIRDYLAQSREDGIRKGVSRTILGRERRYSLPEKPTWPSSNYRQELREYNQRLGRIGRQSANATIQGTSADITKLALVYCYERLPREIKILLAVHDEIILEAPNELADYGAAVLEIAMKDAAEAFMPDFPVGSTAATIADYWTKE